MNCKTCNTDITTKYCPNCGQPNELKRIDGHYIIHEIEHILHFERGILYTIRELITNPGPNIRNYLTENRNRLVKPIIFIIVTSLIYSLSNNFFHFEDSLVSQLDAAQSTNVVSKWVQGHYGYANIIMGVFIALWTKLFFREYQFNFFEILILLCFVMGIGMLIFALFAMIQGLMHVNLIQFAGIVAFVYITWAIGHFFDKAKIASYAKALFAYILGMLTFTLTTIIIGTLTEILIKH